MTCIASLQTLWNPPHGYKWPSSIIHIYSQCHYTVTFFFITNKTLANPLPHQSETELQSKIQILSLSLSLSLTQPKKKKNKSKHCLNEKPRAVRTVQNNAVRKTNRKSQIPVSKNEKFYQLRRIPAKRSEKWIGTEPRPENGAVSWKNESDSWGNSVKENRNLSRETKNGRKKKKKSVVSVG